MTLPRIPLLASLALVLAACGGGADYGTVEVQLRAGRLDAAEAALAGDPSPRAADLRARIQARREALADLDGRIAEIEALPPAQAVELLRELAARERDALAKERLEAALSRAADRRAEAVAGRGHESAEFLPAAPGALPAPAARPTLAVAEALPSAPPPRDPARDAALIDGVVARVRDELGRREWSRALAELDMALDHAGARVGELRRMADEARVRALREAQEIAAAAVAGVDEDELSRARDRVTRELARFPSGAGLEPLREALADLNGRLQLRRVARDGARPAPPAAAPRVDGGELAARLQAGLAAARAAEDEDDLQAAIDSWLEAAFDRPPGPERHAAVARARALERRLAFRLELGAAVGREPERFADLELRAADARTVTVGEQVLAWSAAAPDLIGRAARLAELSREARLGALWERLARGDAGGAQSDAGRLFQRGELEPEEAAELVAAARGEEPPEGGYLFDGGSWVPRAEAELAEAASALARIEQKLARARPADREALLDELVAFGELAEPTAARALTARWESALKALTRGKTLGQLERLADQRRELDLRREDALALIFDEEEYFYPYRPPEVPPEKARLYWPVQQRVDGLVAALREVWDAPREVKLSAGFRAALEDLAWTRDAAAAFELALDLPAEVPGWVLSLDARAARVALADFAWDADERDQMTYDRAVRARNERLWLAAEELPEAQRPDASERRQVQITNDYRELFGRRCLAWNPLLQEAAGGHSDYMANTGDFGHYESTPERRTPGDRMRLAGYGYGISENCHMGGGDPEGAHNGWTHSSGHHRNLLNPGHREMASAVSSRYWTQNFGVGTGFVGELEEWHD